MQFCAERRVTTAMSRCWRELYDQDFLGLPPVLATPTSDWETARQWRLVRRRRTVRTVHSAAQINQPFSMVVSSRCPGYYRLSPGETAPQGRGCCPLCRQESQDIPCSNQTVIKEDLTSISSQDNELKILRWDRSVQDLSYWYCASSQPQPRKRGRPRIKRNQPPKTRQMSEVTKRKISENNKKFSICKICHKQCRGFRGLVDHMHRDHEDYKPWKCHICDVRTAFVKTLYRHLKQEHGASGSPCPVCGKMFTRAQSMLHHVNKVITELGLSRNNINQSWAVLFKMFPFKWATM